MAKIKSKGAETKKEAIAHQAAACFRQKGFSATSMRLLAQAVGVEAPSLYNHIGGKQDLLTHICFKVADRFENNMLLVAQLQAGFAPKLELFIRLHINLMLTCFDEVYVANHEWKWLKEPALSKFNLRRKQYEQQLLQLLQDGMQNNELKRLHPQASMLIILSAIKAVEYWHRQKAGLSAKDLEENIVTHLLHGLKK